MNIFNLIPLSEKEKKIIKKVAKVSFFLCIMVIISVWLFNKLSLNPDLWKKTVSAENGTTEYFARNKNKFLPLDEKAHGFAAEQYFKKGKYQEAIPHLLRLYSKNNRDRIIHFNLATAYMKAGYDKKSLKEFSALAKEKVSDSLSPQICARYALALYYNGETRNALDQIKNCLKSYPNSAEATCYRGLIELSKNDKSETAKEYLKRAIKLDSTYSEAWYQLARYYMNRPLASREEFLKARESLLKLLENSPLHPRAHARLGMVYYYLNQPKLAEKSYKIALTLNPDDYNVHYNLGEIYYYMMNKPGQALWEYKKAIEINPGHWKALFRAGLISLKNNMINEGTRYLEKAHSIQPANIRVLLQLGVAYEKKGLLDNARNVYLKIIKLDRLNEIAKQKLSLLSGSE